MTRAELIARVESAEGADRELDCRIWCLATNLPFETARVIVPDFRQWQAPYYTGSLDAAMMLVPEGVRTFLNIDGDTGITTAIVDGTQGCAATPALALLAACLRAGGE